MFKWSNWLYVSLWWFSSSHTFIDDFSRILCSFIRWNGGFSVLENVTVSRVPGSESYNRATHQNVIIINTVQFSFFNHAKIVVFVDWTGLDTSQQTNGLTTNLIMVSHYLLKSLYLLRVIYVHVLTQHQHDQAIGLCDVLWMWSDMLWVRWESIIWIQIWEEIVSFSWKFRNYNWIVLFWYLVEISSLIRLIAEFDDIPWRRSVKIRDICMYVRTPDLLTFELSIRIIFEFVSQLATHSSNRRLKRISQFSATTLDSNQITIISYHVERGLVSGES